jgi:diguanylate cyclase (GGDEF)-like protein
LSELSRQSTNLSEPSQAGKSQNGGKLALRETTQSALIEEQLAESNARLAQLELALADAQGDREYYRNKAIQLDDMVFQMRALLQSGKGFSEILQLEALLDAFMSVCRERYNSVCSAVLLIDDLDPEDTFYRVRAYHGLPSTFVGMDGVEEEMLMFKIPANQGLLWQVIMQGDVFSVRNMQGLPRFRTAFEKWQLEELNSDVWVPLVRGGSMLGLLTLGECENGKQIPEADYAFLEEIAAVAATNIDSTLKYEKNARILSNLRTLYDVNQQLANVNDFKQLTIETLATAVGALHAQKANLMLFNAETQQLEIKVVWGDIPKHTRDAINEGRLETKSLAIGEGVAGKAAQLRRPVRVNDRAKIPQFGRQTVHCILSVPLIRGDEVMGVMTLTNKVKDVEGERAFDTLGRFGEDDEHLLLSLADQASVNLHKARLYSASITDRLTGLYNARHFEERLASLVDSSLKNETSLVLAVLDIDHFKRFNDTYGHQAGDFVLSRIAALLKASIRGGTMDACFRYGGEEFTALLPETELPEAVEVLERYRQRVEKSSFEYEGQRLSVTVSVGLARCPLDAKTGQSLFECADRALYASKEAGRNRVSVIDDGHPKPAAVSDEAPSSPQSEAQSSNAGDSAAS